MTQRPRLLAVLFVLALLAISALGIAADWFIAVPEDAEPTYVAQHTCIQCHQRQYDAWVGSHHDRAMDLATPETVLGNFDDQEFTYEGVTSRLFRRDGKYFIHTEGPDGRMADFEVKYVFGFDPLQQYMVEFDDGRVQVLRITWDTHGQRWFYHYPPDVRNEKLEPHDPLHWTSGLSNWNHMCAECHSTGLRKNYDVGNDRFHTDFEQIDVSCQTCHGPGSIHVELARSNSLFWDRNHGYGLPKLKDKNTEFEIGSCAACHARRRRVYPDFRPGGDFLDYYAPQLLREPLYHADGQILDEVYVYGSFLQSKMHAKGIRCTDCHDPHTARLKHEGNKVCTSCHQHPAGKYDVPAHHHHEVGTAGASCVECHMPSKHYMIVDPRRDHSLRVPRPDLSVELGTPNACSACHLDTTKSEKWEHYADWVAAAQAGDAEARQEVQRVDQWCTDAVEEWYKDRSKDKPHYGVALAAAREGKPEAEVLLTRLLKNRDAPAIVQATAIEHLAELNTPTSQQLVVSAISDKEPLKRATAIAGLQNFQLSPDQLVRQLTPALRDPIRLVRTEAARVLARAHGSVLPEDQDAFQSALNEYRTGQLADQDQAAAHYNLGNLALDLGDAPEAIKRYQMALKTDDQFVTAGFNLGLLYSRLGKDKLAAQQYRHLIEKLPDTTLAKSEIQSLLGRAHYRLGLMLARMDQFDDAEASLRTANEVSPAEFDFLYALGIFYLEREQWDKARASAERLLRQFPNSQPAQVLYRDIMRQQSP